jgi:hypothetical protein
MTCSAAREALDALLDGELDAAEEAEVLVHLDACPDCAAELAELRRWHLTLSGALGADEARPTPAERRRTVNAVLAALRPRVPWNRVAALIAIGLSVGIVASAVGFSRPREEQVARLVEGLTEQTGGAARLRLVNEEIERDLAEARQAVAGRGDEDPAARAVAVASTTLSRRLGDGVPEPRPGAAERVSLSGSVDGGTVSVVQLDDGRIRVQTPDQKLEARNMAELQSRHGELCRRYAIGGSDGFLRLGDSSAGADWKGRLDLLLRAGTWDETVQLEAYRGWLSSRAGDVREIERRLKAHQERCRSGAEVVATVESVPVDVDALVRKARTLTRTELLRTQEKLENELKRLEDRLREAGELRARARGLRIFAEDVARD